MKVAISRTYGPPEVVEIEEIEKPVPAENEILIKIMTSPVTQVDAIFRSGSQFLARLFTGLLKPRFNVLGSEFAGEVVEIGSEVTNYKAGDHVIGCSEEKMGTHAEYLTLPEKWSMIRKPDGLTDIDAVAAMHGAITATPFLREGAKLQPGQSILINGASGAIGAIGVQQAKLLGAHVTGVCSGANVELVKSLGADEVIDYTVEDFSTRDEAYDVIFDTIGKSSYWKGRSSLKPGGVYLTTAPKITFLFTWLYSMAFSSKKGKAVFAGMRTPEQKVTDMTFTYDLMAAGKIKAVIDQTWPLDKIVEAHRLVDTGHKKGSVVLIVGDNN
ncbi:MAG: NAD(P)-dependent alcohol dehydrogenase [Nitrospinota bacterium]|nr:NAD(P)-dependent alcohol dehydrogenase [Nitrospinota bacterium]